MQWQTIPTNKAMIKEIALKRSCEICGTKWNNTIAT